MITPILVLGVVTLVIVVACFMAWRERPHGRQRYYTFEAFNADRRMRKAIQRKHGIGGKRYRKMQRALKRMQG